MTSARNLILGTRGSQLALVQARVVADSIETKLGYSVSLKIIRTEGDNTDLPFSAATRPGVFVSTLRDALLANEIDLVVHSFKDLPSGQFPGTVVAAVPEREDPRDALVSRNGTSLAHLPAGAKVGTSSPRRAARVRALRGDLEVKSIRGNVDSRISKVESGEYEATVLAVAGLNRLGRSSEIAEYFDFQEMLPAPAQGALAVECRSDDSDLIDELALLDHAESRLLTTAERAVLLGVNASCTTAIGAIAVWANQQLTVAAELSHPTLNWHERISKTVPLQNAAMLSEAHQLGRFVAEELMATPLGAAIITESR